jgi:deoxyribonuclease V
MRVMRPLPPHVPRPFPSPIRWPRTPRAAIALQKRLRPHLILAGGPRAPKTVAGADLAYDLETDRLYAVVVVLSFPALELLETVSVVRRVTFPYVPGLLSFREAPAVLSAWKRLRRPADLLLCDGQGIAHPRGIGLASHIGLVLDVPTVGCAKSLLVGTHGPLGRRRGSTSPLRHDGRVVGAAVRTRDGVNPLYVSPGHRVGIAAAVRLALACGAGFRVPEPTRLADRIVGRLRRGAAASGTLENAVLESVRFDVPHLPSAIRPPHGARPRMAPERS